MKTLLTIFTLVFTVMFSSSGHAAGVKVKKPYLGEAPMFQMIQSDAKANIIFFNGGPGWWGNLRSKNFLIREREKFFSRDLNVYLFPNKKKKYKMSYDDRLHQDHISRIRELVRDIRTQNDLPIILAGHAGGQFRTGRHVDLKGDVPMNNLYLRMLQEIGAPAGALGDSTGILSQV